MKKVILLMMILLFVNIVVAVEVPEEKQQSDLQTIANEHDKTRDYVKSENNRMINEFTKRADYYEDTFKSVTAWTVVKVVLGLIGSVFLVQGFFHMIKIKTEQKRYGVLKDTLQKDIVDDIKKDHLVLPKEVLDKIDKIAEAQGYNSHGSFLSKIKANVEQKKSSQANNTNPVPSDNVGKMDKKTEKLSYFKRRKLSKQAKKLEKLQQALEKERAKQGKV